MSSQIIAKKQTDLPEHIAKVSSVANVCPSWLILLQNHGLWDGVTHSPPSYRTAQKKAEQQLHAHARLCFGM